MLMFPGQGMTRAEGTQVRVSIDPTAACKEQEMLESRPKLSLAMIVKDEQDSIALILEDASSFCDELVVIDTGSTDNTVQIALDHGATVHFFEWEDDFAKARNFAFSKCQGDWIIWLDADDRVPPASQQAFRRIKAELLPQRGTDIVLVPYQLAFDNARNICVATINRERIIRRGCGLKWIGEIHEHIPVPIERAVISADAWVEHRPSAEEYDRRRTRNLEFLARARANGDNSARTTFYFANECLRNELWDEALAAYYSFLPRALSDTERYTALYRMADCARALGNNRQYVEFLLQAIGTDSSRAEAFVKLGVFYYEQEQWSRAIAFFAAAQVLNRPIDDVSLVLDGAYSWLPEDFLAICLSELGRHKEAFDHTVRILPSHPDRDRLLANLRFYADRLSADEHSSDLSS